MADQSKRSALEAVGRLHLMPTPAGPVDPTGTEFGFGELTVRQILRPFMGQTIKLSVTVLEPAGEEYDPVGRRPVRTVRDLTLGREL